ncbi:CoA pyrophosphatase [bacterium]|nr:CoA pyrophosphatase [bacterium]
MYDLNNLDVCRNLIRSIYDKHDKRRIETGSQIPASVLIPFFEKDGQTFILFAKRTQTVRHHKGQISFPGGALDGIDKDLLHAALRETEEEIGIKKDNVDVIAELDDMVTPTNFHVTPFVGIIPYPYEFNLNPHETAELIEIPLSHLLNNQYHRLGYRRFLNRTYEIHYYDYKEHTVWGVTGLILFELLEKLRTAL